MYQSTNMGGPYQSIISLPKVNTTWVSNLTADVTYYFVVTAYNTQGESPYSNEARYTAKGPKPTFLTQPVSSTNYYGAAVTLSATATNVLWYQWFRNNTPVAWANSTSLTLYYLKWNSSGNYVLVATNKWWSTTSAPAKVYVNPPYPSGVTVSRP